MWNDLHVMMANVNGKAVFPKEYSDQFSWSLAVHQARAQNQHHRDLLLFLEINSLFFLECEGFLYPKRHKVIIYNTFASLFTA